MSNFHSKDIIKTVSHWSWIILSLCFVFQCLFFWSYNNIIALISITLTWAIITIFFLNRKILKEYSLSTVIIIGFASTQFYLPLLFTSLENKSLLFNLVLPFQVFFHSLAILFVLIIAHSIYQYLSKTFNISNSSILYRAGLFKPPTESQLWLMGFIGVAANLYAYFVSPSVGREITGSSSEKLIQSLNSFSYTPYFILLAKMYGNNKINSKRIVLQLVSFTVLLLMISIVRNSRAVFMYGFTSVAFAFGLGLLLGIYKIKVFTWKNVIVGSLGFWVLTGPLADLGTAMIIVREKRSAVSSTALIDLTLDTFKDKEAINSRRLEDNEREDDWDERYLDNVFTARFSNLKFNDLSLIQASKIQNQDVGMLNFSIDYLYGALPDPFLKVVGINVDKGTIYSVSFGDYLYYRATNDQEVLGGYRTGHIAGTGMAAFGYWYLLILGIAIIPIFYLFDILVLKKNEICFSLCGLLTFTSVFMFLPSESVVTTGTFLVRGWIQMVLLYLIVYYFTSIMTRLFKGFRIN